MVIAIAGAIMESDLDYFRKKTILVIEANTLDRFLLAKPGMSDFLMLAFAGLG